MEYIIIKTRSSSDLITTVNVHINNGWKPIGGVSVVEQFRQNVFAGTQHKHTTIKHEYSQAMIKEN